MFFMIFMMFLLGGSLCIMLPLMFPQFFIYMVYMMMMIMGIMMIWIGAILYIMRSIQTGGFTLNELAKPNEVLTLHERRGGSASLKKGKIDILEHIRVKGMIFKDTGGGMRLAGHRIVHTKETVNHTIPEWAAQYIHNIHDKYMVEDPESLKRLYEQLKNLKKPIPGLDVSSLESQLLMIPEMKLAMQEPKKREELLKMSLEDLRQMSEVLYDGQTVHMEDYEKFQEAASPYDLESYTKKHEIHRMMQWFHYKEMGSSDWMKWVLPIAIMLILGAIAYQIFGSGG